MNLNAMETAKPFIDGVVEVLSMMAMITPEPGTPFMKDDNSASGDVSAVIGLTGPKNGSFSVSFEKECAYALVRNMLGDSVEDIVQDAKDAVGEISNMISGRARSGLSEMGFEFKGSTPSIIMGDGHTITHIAASTATAVPFTTEHGSFVLEYCFEE